MRWRTLVLSGVFGLAGCIGPQEQQTVEAAAARFHAEADGGQYDQIYNESGPQFRVVTGPIFNAFMSKIALKMGPCRPAVRVTNVASKTIATGGEYIVERYNRICTSGVLTETFTFRMVNGQAKLVAYNAANPLLLT